MTKAQELEERIKNLERRVSLQDEAIKRTLHLVRQAIETQFKQWKEDQGRFKRHSVERMNSIMNELGYKTDSEGDEPD